MSAAHVVAREDLHAADGRHAMQFEPAQSRDGRIVEDRAPFRASVEMQIVNGVVGRKLNAVAVGHKGDRRVFSCAAQPLSRRQTDGRCIGQSATDDNSLDTPVFDCRDEGIDCRDPLFHRIHWGHPPFRNAIKALASAAGCSSGTK
jgi:hypothetical protein